MNETFEEMLERYKAEMLRYAPPKAEPGPLEGSPAEESYVLAEEPLPEEEESLKEPPFLLQTESPRVDDQVKEENTAEATLTVQVYSAGGALPIEGAVVTITRKEGEGNLLIAALLTDDSGRTVPVLLPAPPAEESTSPNGDHPFAEYNVRTDKAGYFPVSNLSLSLFGGVSSLQPVELIPIPERETDVKEIQIFESQNPNL